MSERVCPLLVITCEVTGKTLAPCYCLGEECAWWNEHFGCCGLVAEGEFWAVWTSREESDED